MVACLVARLGLDGRWFEYGSARLGVVLCALAGPATFAAAYNKELTPDRTGRWMSIITGSGALILVAAALIWPEWVG